MNIIKYVYIYICVYYVYIKKKNMTGLNAKKKHTWTPQQT